MVHRHQTNCYRYDLHRNLDYLLVIRLASKSYLECDVQLAQLQLKIKNEEKRHTKSKIKKKRKKYINKCKK